MSLRDPDDPNVERYEFALATGAYDTRPSCSCGEPRALEDKAYCAVCSRRLRWPMMGDWIRLH